jgi:hypothetical protein
LFIQLNKSKRNNPDFDIKQDAMPAAIATKLISGHAKYLQTRSEHDNAEPGPGFGEAGASADTDGRQHIGDGAIRGKTPARSQFDTIPDYAIPPKLHLPLRLYPSVRECLGQLSDKSIGRDFTMYTAALSSGVGANTVGELLDAIYNDLRNGKYNKSLNDALEAYIHFGKSPTPLPVHVQIIARHFVTMCKAFEDSQDY